MYQSKIRNNKQRSKHAKNRVFIEPDDDQELAVVQDMLGNGRVRTLCGDGVVRVGRIRGSMRKYAGKVIIERNDLVIVSRREFEDDKVDIIHKYNADETAKILRNHDVPPEIVKAINKTDTDVGTSHDYVVFADEPADEEACDSDVDIDRI